MLSTKVLPSLVLAGLLFKGYTVIRDRVQGSAHADFTYASRVDSTPDSKLEIENSITNNATGRLAVRWDDAGIVCSGFGQLEPQEVQSKKSVAQEPYAYDHSEIRYGNSMQYSASGRCYRDGQARPRDQTRTQFTRHDAAGNEKYKIEVKSEIGPGGHGASISFSVKGNLSLVLPSRIADEVKTLTKGGTWEIIKTTSLDGVSIEEGDRQIIRTWLDKTPVPKGDSAAPDFVVLLNKKEHGNEITLPLAGGSWGLEQVYIIAYVPNTLGVLGFTADVYLPG